MASTAPLWRGTLATKTFFKDPIAAFRPHLAHTNPKGNQPEALLDLEVENEQLRQTIQKLNDVIMHEWEVESELLQALKLADIQEKGSAFYQRRQEELMRLIDNQVQAYGAKVIFRDPASWSSSLWINVGAIDNQALGRMAVSKNSPVTVGLNVIGIVDYVGQRQSRVRLITDPGLTPSVRACRGFPHDLLLRERVDALVKALNIYPSKQVESVALQALALAKTLPLPYPSGYFAKGELRGSAQSLWRSKANLLKGVGFNMDFADEEGPARDLRTGATAQNKTPIPLLQVGDLLITTGMDGIFPAGLRIAEIVRIEILREGSYTYEIQAKPLVPNLNDISTVFVLPAIGYDEDDKPQPYGR
ncbi:MAG: rod shape-determining protein MreC [Parachlamydiales bacterium]|nr:rod shape-determining protein MreC [Parachlamydiales bacterium]